MRYYCIGILCTLHRNWWCIRIGTQQVQSGILPQTGFFLEALEISQHFSRTSLEDAATPASGPLAESASKTTGRGKLKFRF